MTLQDQINAIAAQQGGTTTEDDLLHSPVVHHEDVAATNACYRVELASGTVAFHKPFAGVAVRLAADYGHTDPDQVPIQEVAAWRLASALGEPVSRLVCTCVLRTVASEPGSLSLLASGEPAAYTTDLATVAEHASTGAFFDSLIAQQDRHGGNFLLNDSGPIGLIDHGYAFALPGHHFNAGHLVEWRHCNGDPTLNPWERTALARLLDSSDLLGLATILHPDRADALAKRAERMQSANTILRPGVF